MKLKFKNIKPGMEFKYNNIYFLKYSKTMSIINRYTNVRGYYCPFDNIDNNYNDSLIRYYINYRFLKLNNIKYGDLQTLPGGDFAKLLSKSEYEKIKPMLAPMSSWWLRSPLSSHAYGASYATDAWGEVLGMGIDGDPVNGNHGVRPALKFNPEVEVEVASE